MGERSCKPVLSRGGRSERVDSDDRQLGQGLVHLPGRQVLELDRAELADRVIGKTPVILDGAGLPRRESVVAPVPDAGRHRVGSGDAKPGLEFAVECLELLPDFGLWSDPGPSAGSGGWRVRSLGGAATPS